MSWGCLLGDLLPQAGAMCEARPKSRPASSGWMAAHDAVCSHWSRACHMTTCCITSLRYLTLPAPYALQDPCWAWCGCCAGRLERRIPGRPAGRRAVGGRVPAAAGAAAGDASAGGHAAGAARHDGAWVHPGELLTCRCFSARTPEIVVRAVALLVGGCTCAPITVTYVPVLLAQRMPLHPTAPSLQIPGPCSTTARLAAQAPSRPIKQPTLVQQQDQR